MKKIKKISALCLLLAMLVSVVAPLSACGDETVEPSDCTEHADLNGDEICDVCGVAVSKNDDEEDNSDSKTKYSAEVVSIGGTKLKDVYINIVDTSNGNKLVDYGKTDANGYVSFELPTSNKYAAVVADCPTGYTYDEIYPFTTSGIKITLVSGLIADTGLAGVSYNLGDIMHDFTVVDSDNNVITLSEIFKTKKAVLLNFWYTTCSWCIEEFPDMQAAYEKHKDNVEIIALNAYPNDSNADIVSFKSDMGLTFPMAKDTVGLQDAFGFTANPCSVMIDRYGVITVIEIGAVIGERYFSNAFEHFTSDGYKQELLESLKVLSPTQLPTFTMPSSDEISSVFDKGSLNVEYYGATGDDAEYNWPFVIDTFKNEQCIRPSNIGIDASYSIINASVELKAGEALMFDFYSSTQQGADILYILVDGKDIYSVSGVEEEGWQKCCAYVAKESATYEVSFCFYKDESDSDGDDTVYLKNLRIVDESEVNTPSYIFRFAATGLTEDNAGYENYVEVFYNESDGYYHVGDVNGPLLIANLLGYTNFDSFKTVTERLYASDTFMVNGVDRFVELEQYCNYASNSQLYGYCTVTKELREYLEVYADLYTIELGKDESENNWLQLCLYYDAYGTQGKQLEDPIKGLATFSAFEAKLGSDNKVEYKRVIMPRGYLYKFTPEISGVYRVTSNSKNEVDGWIFLPAGENGGIVDENGERVLLAESATGERYCEELLIVDPNGDGEQLTRDLTNCTMVAYMEAGKDYYIDIAFYDVYCFDSFTFEVKYIAESFNHFREASPGPFTFDLTLNGGIGDTIAGGIKVKLGDDGYYHHLKEDGTLGSVVYADFHWSTNIFPSSTMLQLIDSGAFDFSKNENDQRAIVYYNKYLKEALTQIWGADFEAKWAKYESGELTLDEDTKVDCDIYIENALRTLWADSFESEWESYQMEDILDGIYHGTGKDMTELVRSYIEKMENDVENNPERQGCVAVDEALAEALQLLMDKFTFKGVENSWTKLCYYYELLGPQISSEN